MSSLQLTEQSVDPPTPSQDGGKKTIIVFAKDSGGTTVIKAKDSAGGETDFVGPQGNQGIQGDQGIQGPAGTVDKLLVADINDPSSELASQGGVTGDPRFIFQDGDPTVGSLYIFDSTITTSVNIPYVIQGTGGRWIALLSKFSNDGIDVLGDLKTAANVVVGGTVDGRDVAADGTKLDGIESGATADQTAGEIKTAYESNGNTNAFEDADESKLDGIEAGATADAPGGAPPDIAASSDAGSNDTFSRSNHTHGHGVQLGGSLHAVATPTMNGFLSAADKAILDGLTKSTFSYTGGVSAVGSTSQTPSSMGHNNSNAGVVMARNGKVIAITISLTAARTAGQCDGMITLNGVLQNGAGQFAIIDAVDTQTAFIVLATPIAYAAGDIIELVSNTTSFTPTTSDATLAILTEDT